MTEREKWDADQLRGRLGILQAAATLYATGEFAYPGMAVQRAFDLWDAVVAEDERRKLAVEKVTGDMPL